MFSMCVCVCCLSRVLYVCSSSDVLLHYMETGFSWLLNAIPAADTPRAGYEGGCGLLYFDNTPWSQWQRSNCSCLLWYFSLSWQWAATIVLWTSFLITIGVVILFRNSSARKCLFIMGLHLCNINNKGQHLQMINDSMSPCSIFHTFIWHLQNNTVYLKQGGLKPQMQTVVSRYMLYWT